MILSLKARPSVRDNKLLEVGLQALIVLVASFIFPVTQSMLQSSENSKQASFQAKESILKTYSAEFEKYISYYSAYVKVCTFLSSNEEKYLGLDRSDAGKLRFSLFNTLLSLQSPDTLLVIAGDYYDNKKIHELSLSLIQKIRQLTNLDLTNTESDEKCDMLTKEIGALHTAIVSLMAIDLRKSIK